MTNSIFFSPSNKKLHPCRGHTRSYYKLNCGMMTPCGQQDDVIRRHRPVSKLSHLMAFSRGHQAIIWTVVDQSSMTAVETFNSILDMPWKLQIIDYSRISQGPVSWIFMHSVLMKSRLSWRKTPELACHCEDVGRLANVCREWLRGLSKQLIKNHENCSQQYSCWWPSAPFTNMD